MTISHLISDSLGKGARQSPREVCQDIRCLGGKVAARLPLAEEQARTDLAQPAIARVAVIARMPMLLDGCLLYTS